LECMPTSAKPRRPQLSDHAALQSHLVRFD
jgi:hypothetical protein